MADTAAGGTAETRRPRRSQGCECHSAQQPPAREREWGAGQDWSCSEPCSRGEKSNVTWQRKEWMQWVVYGLIGEIKQGAAYAVTCWETISGTSFLQLKELGKKIWTNMKLLKRRRKTQFFLLLKLILSVLLGQIRNSLVRMRERVRCKQLIFVQKRQTFKLPVLLLMLDTSHGWGFYP